MPKRADSSLIRRGKKSKTFWLHFNKFDAAKGAPDIWTVRFNGKNHYTKKVYYKGMETRYRGRTGRQPKAYLKGYARISIHPDHITIF